ncbi:MAG: methyltransferase domain-containing protein [Candidatus Coatesbacteria bacterium]|nr:methyltransferase domain-containing protein [Candidatus Coatesbacteria bacterium]
MERSGHWTDDFFEDLFGRVIKSRSDETTLMQIDLLLKGSGAEPGATVLDVCCGYGRHSVELAKRGFQVTGVDLIEGYLAKAREHAETKGVDVEFIKMDVRDLEFDRKFDLVLNMWTSFGFYDEETNLDILKRLGNCVARGGHLVMELINRDWVVKNFLQRSWWPVDDNLIIFEEREFDITRSINRCVWNFLEDGKVKKMPLDLRVYSAHELILLLKSVGFGDVEAISEPDGARLTFDSRMMMIIAKMG